jgi:hypothetical protein
VPSRAAFPLLRPAWCVLACGLVWLLAGCSSAAQPEVEKVAATFENPAVDARSRCDLLAPTTRDSVEQSSPCAAVLTQLPFQGGHVRSVQVWGGGAQAKVGGDTVFLTETDSGWKVTAALCQPRGEAPYQCQVEGQ